MSDSGTREIVVAMKNAVAGDAYSLAFEGCFAGLRVTTLYDFDEVRQTLRRAPEAFVLLDAQLAGPALPALFAERAALARRAVLLVVGGDVKSVPAGADASGVHFLPAQPAVKELLAKVEDVFRLAELAVQYCRITPQALRMRSRDLPCDVYMKLSEGKYLKVLHEGDPFGQEEFERFFTQKKAQHLYFPRAGFLKYMEEVLAEANALNLDPDKLTVEKSSDAMSRIFDSVHSLFEMDGFTPQVQMMTMTSINLALNTMKKNPKLSDLLGKLDANRDSYLSWHSTALSFLSCKLATAVDWKSDATFNKLALASFLHDLTLPDDDTVRFHDQAGEEKPSDAMLDLVRSHPLDAALLVNGMAEIPGEVAFILAQHHENAEATGYPKAIGTRDISPIAALFIISHDLVNALYRAPPGEFEMERYLFQCESEKRFTKGSFGQVFRGIMAKLKDM